MRTKQGVRDLNGPSLNGKGHNGNRAAGCPHNRDPGYPTTPRQQMRSHKRSGLPPIIALTTVYYCDGCGEERWFDAPRGVAGAEVTDAG